MSETQHTHYCAECLRLTKEIKRLKGLCPHAQDGTCIDWQAEVMRLRKARDAAKAKAAQADALAEALGRLGVDRGSVRCFSPGICGKRHHYGACEAARTALAAYQEGRQP